MAQDQTTAAPANDGETGTDDYTAPRCRECGTDHDRACSSCTLPKAPYYVVSHDTFMSGWRHMYNQQNNPIVACESYAEAVGVLAYVKSRGDQKRARIVTTKPRPRGVLNLVPAWRDRAVELVRDHFAFAEREVDYSDRQALRNWRDAVASEGVDA